MNRSLIRLMAGFRRFRKKYVQGEGRDLYQRLALSGQTPKTLLIACSDSRVDPAILTGAAPGDLFVVRNIASLVPPCEDSSRGFHGTSSALEFAVINIQVQNIIVLAHRQCGGVNALIKGAGPKNGFIGRWMEIAADARARVFADNPEANDDQLWRAGERETLKTSIKNLYTFPFVVEAVKNRQMNVLGIYYDLERGELWLLDEKTQKFNLLEI